jgi:hypothetical protein
VARIKADRAVTTFWICTVSRYRATSAVRVTRRHPNSVPKSTKLHLLTELRNLAPQTELCYLLLKAWRACRCSLR